MKFRSNKMLVTNNKAWNSISISDNFMELAQALGWEIDKWLFFSWTVIAMQSYEQWKFELVSCHKYTTKTQLVRDLY